MPRRSRSLVVAHRISSVARRHCVVFDGHGVDGGKMGCVVEYRWCGYEQERKFVIDGRIESQDKLRSMTTDGRRVEDDMEVDEILYLTPTLWDRRKTVGRYRRDYHERRVIG
jgi:hypothetical protein